MNNLGDYAPSTVVYGKFTTYRPSTGAAYTLAGTPALSVYKDNSATQSTTGVTLTADFDTVTGLNHFAIDTSADGTFYSAGSNFDIVITTGTVDSVSVVGSVVGSFSINKVAALRPTTAARTLDVASTGEAGLDFANVNLGAGQTLAALIADYNTSQAVGATSITLAAGTPLTTDSAPIGAMVWLPATGRTGFITAYVASTQVATIGGGWSDGGTPTGTPVYMVLPVAPASSALPVTANVTQWNGTNVAAPATAGYPAVTIKSGTGTGEVSLSSGAVLLQATQTGVTIPTVTNLTNAASNGDFTATMKSSLTSTILTTALTEAYAADGAAGTVSELLFGINAFLQERSVSGTTVTVKKLDGSTTAMTFTLDSGTTPTSITRAT